MPATISAFSPPPLDVILDSDLLQRGGLVPGRSREIEVWVAAGHGHHVVGDAKSFTSSARTRS